MEKNYMLAYGSAEASLRQRILFNKVSGDGTRDLTCFWSASGIESGAPSGLVPARLPTFHASTQGPWHAVIAYDACVRLCLHAWAKQCMEAPMFLENECALLRDTFRYFLSSSLLLVECGRVKIMTNFCFCNPRKNHDENF
ncbi:unnamed protein product [Camellia sinensis]